MSPDILHYLFGVNHYAAKVNLEDITQEESLRQPASGGHCMNWVFGHIVASRNSIFELLDQPPVWTAEQVEPYRRGTIYTPQPAGLRELLSIRDDFDRSQEILAAALQNLTVEQFERRIDEKKSLGQSLAFLQFHEGYHIGQLGLLRRIVGKDGVIK